MLFNRAGQIYINMVQAQLLYYLMQPYWQAVAGQINKENQAQYERCYGRKEKE